MILTLAILGAIFSGFAGALIGFWFHLVGAAMAL